MKSIISTILSVLCLSIAAVAQVDRSVAPEPGPAPEIQIADYQSFELKNGLKVFVVENNKIPRVAFSLILDNEPIMEGDKAGYVSTTGQLLRSGTTNRTKAQLDEEIDFIGASLSTSSNGIFASSLTKHKEKLLELMTDVLFNPSFPQDELEKIRKQTLSGLAAAKEDPSAIANNVSSVVTYSKDHPYGELTTEETVENITLEDCKAYYNKYFKPNVGYLAVVGDISVKEAKSLVKEYFNDWEKGEIVQPTYETPQAPESTYIAMVDRSSSVQSVIDVTYPIALEPGNPDVIKARVLNQILGGGFSSRLMQNLREDKAFTYGARSSLSSDDLVGNFSAGASVRNEVTDSAVHEFLYELKKIKNEPVEEKELMAAKASIIGSFARSLESPQTIANFAINSARYDLPEDYYANYLKNVSETSLDDVKNMANKYIKPEQSNIVIVGKASEVAESLKQFGDVKYFDIYGNEYEPSAKMALPAGLTAEKVIEDYINAIGGKEKLESVNTIKTKMSADMMGNQIDMMLVKKAPNKFVMEAKMGGTVAMRQTYDGEEASAMQMGQSMPVNEAMKKEMAFQAIMFPELQYEKLEVETKLVGVEKIEGSNAYAVEVTLPSGTTATHYFDTKSGLKIRESKVVNTPQGEVATDTEIGEYKEVEGIMFPHVIKQPMGGGMKMVLKTQSVEINGAVDDSAFQK
ncbi:insulinase family protein [Fulvivirga sp. RKSG066]|uniref:M16 family metallopeptidase n=1 Tax=Fulvivirga aurantia TaxID=2529383 RepID=UPI0012BCF192|nr:pitrilysin family protein [Fulvivirga aurantia]MTI21449.1 insulinase family protein [Fulvivirga aurantia]